ncbi:hypothetical protein GIB67_040371 [Kingdonia uniflora]|uniref:Cytochrome P450 n=1 Tax=Kingdonia uniflora TaxID=39325 RepID=A0A7J7L9K7_9MAGN|nr:hypothetical protein GIB67_040371 [Kingdonia uniflora]
MFDPKVMKEMLSDKFSNFEKPPVNPLFFALTRSLTSLEGEKWAKHKRIINPAFHLDKLKGMVPTFLTSCSKMIEKWKKLVGAEGSFELDIWPKLEYLLEDVISSIAFGSNYKDG